MKNNILLFGLLIYGFCVGCQNTSGNKESVIPNSPYDVCFEPTSDVKRGDIITITYKLDKDGIIDFYEDFEVTDDHQLKYTGNDPAWRDHVEYVEDAVEFVSVEEGEKLRYRTSATYYEEYQWGKIKVKIPETAATGPVIVFGQGITGHTGLSEDILYIHDESGDVIYSEGYKVLDK